MPKNASVNTLSFSLRDVDPFVAKALWRAHVTWVLGYREGAQVLEALRSGQHPSLSSEDAASLMRRVVDGVLGARASAEEGVDKNGAVRYAAGKLFGVLSNPASIAIGVQNNPNPDLREALLQNPTLIGTPEYLKLIPGRARTRKALFVSEKDSKDIDRYRGRLRSELRDAPFAEWSEKAQTAFMELVDKMLPEDADGGGPIRRLRVLKVLGPEAPPVLRTIDEVAFGKAVSRLRKGFFSASATMLASHATRSDQAREKNQERDAKRQKILDSIPVEHRAILEGIEQELTAYFETQSKHPAKEPFRILPRSVKSFQKVRQAWLKAGVTDLPKRTREVQAQVKHDFGSVPLFDLLAQDRARPVWEGEDYAKTSLSRWIDYRNLKAHRMPRLTYPDPVDHPVWIEFGGANALPMAAPRFPLAKELGTVELRLPDAAGHWHDITVKVDWNRRYVLPRRGEQGRIKLPGYPDGVAFTYGGAKLILDRSALGEPVEAEKVSRALQIVAEWQPAAYGSQGQDMQRLKKINEIVDLLYEGYGGRLPTAWLDTSITIANKVQTDSDIDLKKRFREYMKTRSTDLRNCVGLRIMGIDLGFQNAGGYAILHIVEAGTPTTGRFLDMDGVRVLVERVETLTLPGDLLPKPYEETRLLEFLEAGKRFLGLQSSLLHGLQEQAPFTPLPAEELDLGAKTVPLLQALFDAPDRETALHACEALNRRLLKIVRERYRGLRSRRGQGHVHAGRMYLIRQLISYECSYASRRFLGATGKIVVGQKRGLYQLPQIRNLRNKLTNLVLDRIQKAGGQFVRLAIQHRVHVVAMEDLAGWQRRTEQDKRMNRLLILWSHRRISEALERGLPREGILLCTAWPAWTSRIDAWGRPGLRCRPVEGWMQRRPEGSRIGDLIPWRKGGTVWASVQDNALVTYGSEEVAAISIGKALLRGPQESISSVEVFKIPDGSGFIVNLPHHLAGLEFDPHTGFQTKRHPTLLDELRKDSAETQKFFRDLSGDVISATVWLGVGEFWDSVEAHVTDVLRESWKQQTEIAAE